MIGDAAASDLESVWPSKFLRMLLGTAVGKLQPQLAGRPALVGRHAAMEHAGSMRAGIGQPDRDGKA